MSSRHSGARTIAQVLDQSLSLSQLGERLQASRQCLDAVLPLIPFPMRQAVHAGPIERIEEDTNPTAQSTSLRWTLLSDNAAAATKLRQLQPLMLQALEKAGIRIDQLQIQVLISAHR